MAEDLLAAVRRVRREVVDSMRVLMKYAKVLIKYFLVVSFILTYLIKYIHVL